MFSQVGLSHFHRWNCFPTDVFSGRDAGKYVYVSDSGSGRCLQKQRRQAGTPGQRRAGPKGFGIHKNTRYQTKRPELLHATHTEPLNNPAMNEDEEAGLYTPVK